MSQLDIRIENPLTLVIFGATGDLTRRKLIPALFTLFKEGALPEHFTIVGFARRDFNNGSFRAEMARALREHSRLPPEEHELTGFCERLIYHKGDLADASAYDSLATRFSSGELPTNRLFYLSVTPELMAGTVDCLQIAGLITRPHAAPWTRVIVEKPFGTDLLSARALNNSLLARLDESQIYRIDHYLGKETVQNILSFRFANAIFEPVFNRTYVDHIQITAAETVGMESGRGAFYDRTGALRDMVVNHIFQLLCLVTMEPPAGLEARSVRNEKMKILRALRLADPCRDHPAAIFGQYAASGAAPAFRNEERIDPQSQTETFAALRMEINNWRWAGVPIYLRTGKRMAKKTTEIAVQFKTPPLSLFQHVACKDDVCDLTGIRPNTLVFRIQPDEGIFLQISAKRPSMQMVVESVTMDFTYSGKWSKRLPDAYERLLLDALRGDSTLFTRSDEVEAEWDVIDPALVIAGGEEPHSYPAGSWGPAEATSVLLNGAEWRNE